MDEETREIMQSLLDLIRANSAQLNRLQAFNALQNQIIVALLQQVDSFKDNQPETIDAYERVRRSALQTIELADDREGFDALLLLADQKFLGIYD